MEIVNEEDTEIIKTFLKVGKPKVEEKPYYDIDLEKNIITLHDPITKIQSDKDSIIEVNQVFTNKHEYSYIYEQVCQDTIEESLKGNSFIFVSYGISTSEKLEMLIGNIEDSNRNINHIGIFPRLLDQLINTINKNKEYKDNLSINLSYMCLHETKLIDLSNYIGKDFSDYTSDKFLKDGMFIDSVEIIKQVKKVPTENYKDVLYFINKILLYFRKLEDDSNGKLFTKSHIIIIIYITNNEGKNISKLTFILLNGSEQLNDDKQRKLKNAYVSKETSKSIMDLNKMALDTQYTYDSILNAIRDNESLFGKKKISANLNEENLDLEEKKNLSRLTKVLYYPCFSRKIKNTKYIIIGSIMPFPGCYNSVKDTLLYLFECRKINISINKIRNKANSSQKTDKLNKNIGLKMDEDNDTVFNLEQKIKFQEHKIVDLNNIIESKTKNIETMKKSYKKQIDILKDNFGFKGDVNILLSGHEYSKEMKNAKEIKDAIDNLKIYKIKVKELEEKLKKANDEIKRFNDSKEIKINNETMINYYYGVKKTEEERINKDNNLYIEINEYKNELKIKDKIILELQKDLEKKNKILISMPKALKDLHESELNSENEKENEKNNLNYFNDFNNKEKENKKEEKKEIIINQKNYIKSMKTKDNEIKIITKKYENILEQKEKTIMELSSELGLMKTQYETNLARYEVELLKLNELFMNLINNYQRYFLSHFTSKCNPITLHNKKEQFDKILLTIKKEYNMYSFPLLYDTVSKTGVLNQNNINSASMRRASKDHKQNKIENEKIVTLNEKDLAEYIEDQEEGNIISNSLIQFLKEQIELYNIILNKDELKDEPPEKIINEYSKVLKIISNIEDFMKKIMQNIEIKKATQKKKDLKTEYDLKIEKYKNKMDKISDSLDKQITTNNKNKVIINSQNRLIEKLQRDLLAKEETEYRSKLTKNVNKNLGLFINNKEYPSIIANNDHINKSHNFLKNRRGFSAKNKNRRMDTDLSSRKTTINQQTINNSRYYSTFSKVNVPQKMKTEGNI